MSSYTKSSTKHGNVSSAPAYLKKPFSENQYAAPSTSTTAFLPASPQLVPACTKANVKG